MDKNSREKDMLYQWAQSNNKSYCFQEIDNTKESYFEQRMGSADSERYIREYTMESLPELTKELDALWGADDIMCHVKKAIGVAALKNKPVKSDSRETAKVDIKAKTQEKLPVFIYNF